MIDQIEELTRVVQAMRLELKNLSKDVQRLEDRLEQTVDGKLENIQDDVEQISGGLAVLVFNRRLDKKKLTNLMPGLKSWLEDLKRDLPLRTPDIKS